MESLTSRILKLRLKSPSFSFVNGIAVKSNVSRENALEPAVNRT